MDEKHPVGEHAIERVDGNWLVLEYVGNPRLRLDAGLIDRIIAFDGRLVFDVGELRVSLPVSAGAAAAVAIADHLAKYTRLSPVTEADAYAHAKRQFELLKAGTELHQSMLFVGAEPVQVQGQDMRIGSFTCRIYEAIRSGRVGDSITLPSGGRLQAGLALLVVAASERENEGAQVGRRLAEYEDTLRRVEAD